MSWCRFMSPDHTRVALSGEIQTLKWSDAENVLDVKRALESREADLMTATGWTTTQMPVSQDPQYSPQELYDWLANMGHFFHFLSCLLFYTFVDSLLCNSTQLFWEFKTARTKQLVNAGLWLVQIEGLASSWPMREGQPQPPLLCQYYGLRQFWKDRQRNWKINCRQINSMSGQPKFQEHSILFKSVCLNSPPHDHIAFKTGEETQKRDQLFGQWRSGKAKGNLMRCCPRVIGPQIWQSADIAKIGTQRHAQYVVMCADMVVELTWRKYFHSPIKGGR